MDLRMKCQSQLRLWILVLMQIRTHQHQKIKQSMLVKHQKLKIQLAMLVIFQVVRSSNSRHQWIQQHQAIKKQLSLWLIQMVLRTKCQSQLRLWTLVLMRTRTHQLLRIKLLMLVKHQKLKIQLATSEIFQKELSLNSRLQWTLQLRVIRVQQ